jgi:hypothetical protein
MPFWVFFVFSNYFSCICPLNGLFYPSVSFASVRRMESIETDQDEMLRSSAIRKSHRHPNETPRQRGVSAIKPYEGFGDVDHTIKELMSL